MRVVNQAPNYQSQLQKLQTPSVKSGGSVFGQQLDIAARRSADSFEIQFPKNRVRPDSVWEFSPYCNLMEAYNQWKGQQPSQELPSGQGATEENMAYLRERYSGELSWVERVDMLNTMMDMGVITREQRNSAYGDDTVVLTPDMTQAEITATIEAHRKNDPWNQDWNVYFSEDPVNTFKTADDVFSWLGQVLDGEK